MNRDLTKGTIMGFMLRFAIPMIFLTSILLGLCMGSGAVFSIRFGQRDEKGLREYLVVILHIC